MEGTPVNLKDLEVIPMIDEKPVSQGEMIGYALSVISLKNPNEDSDPDRVVKRNSFRDLHRPNISHLDWVAQSPSKEEAVVDKVKSFHSRQSLSRSSGHDADQQHSSLIHAPIKEESREVISDKAFGEESDERIEHISEIQSLPELDKVSSTQVKTEPEVQQSAKVDEEKRSTSGQHRSGSRSTITTELSRHFEFVEDTKTGVQRGGGGQDKVKIHSAWSQQEMKRLESRADNVLVEMLPALELDDVKLLDQAADDLTTDAMNVAIQRVNAAKPLPLPATAIQAAEVFTIDSLKRAIGDRPPANCSSSKCVQENIKLASAIVRRVLNSPSSKNTTWSEQAVHAASLLVEDVLSSASGDDGDVAKPDHAWSRDAVLASCLIVRDVMREAARTASTGKQRARAGQKQTPQPATTNSQDKDYVNLGHAADQHDVLEQSSLAPHQQKHQQEQKQQEPTVSEPTNEPITCCRYEQDSFNDSCCSRSSTSSHHSDVDTNV